MNNIGSMLTRRRLLEFGSRGALGLSLGGLWWAQEAEGAPVSSLQKIVTPAPLRACILIFFYGGPSHIDTLDMKPDAPREVRGEFKPISTSVPGLQICEHLP